MTATSEEFRALWENRPARPPAAVSPSSGGGRTEQFLLSLTGLLPLVYEQAWQTVLGPGFRLQIIDWRATRADVQDVRLAERLAQEAAAWTPLDQGPGMRATLIRRDDRTWSFAWRYRRDVMDRAAGLRLLDQATEAYAVLLRGGTPRRPQDADNLFAGRVNR
ncbi:hypothetical protein [Streptomyces finlayi]|uniref:hypothetical protein n=1 Tax=Streptomyces finlayi TaxID=67296 RepID=UPI001624F7F4|nr:hypothetical protein [Streptomyces finlayi]